MYYYPNSFSLDLKLRKRVNLNSEMMLMQQRNGNKCFQLLTGIQCNQTSITKIYLTSEIHLVFAGYFWNYFGYSSFKMFNADIFKNDSSLRQQSNICCNFFTLRAQNQSNIQKNRESNRHFPMNLNEPPPPFLRAGKAESCAVIPQDLCFRFTGFRLTFLSLIVNSTSSPGCKVSRSPLNSL